MGGATRVRAPEAKGTRVSGLQEPLEMLTKVSGVLGAVVATEDGLPVAARLSAGQDQEAMAGAAAAIGRLAGKTLGRLGKGGLELARFEGSKVTFLVQCVSVGFLLAAVEPGGKEALVAREMGRAAAALDEVAADLAGR